MKKVLIITYHFPPDAAVGAIRPAKFAKFLPEFGWEPVIYTVKEKYYDLLDYSKFEPALNPLRIHRANLIPGPLHLYSRFPYKGKNFPNNLRPHQSIRRKNQNGINSIKRFFSSMVRLPDDKQGWIANIAIDGYRIFRRHKIDTFITTGPPMSTHVGGLFLKNLTHAKWVADFRDPWWTEVYLKSSPYRTFLFDNIQKWLESKVIKKADMVVSTTPSLTEHFKLNLPPNQQNKFVTITNGFDESDFLGIATSTWTINSKIRIIHTGTLYFSRNPEPFFIALNKLVKRGLIHKDHIEIDLIGNCAFYKGGTVQELIDKYELSFIVRLLGMMPFRKSLENQMDSDALLLFAQEQPNMIPAKVFEYLKINKPIFAITEEGETKRILEDFENVFIADQGKRDDIAKKFLQLLEAIKNGKKYLSSPERIKKYDRRYLTEKLAGYLDMINQS
jgi:hypothetical protein